MVLPATAWEETEGVRPHTARHVQQLSTMPHLQAAILFHYTQRLRVLRRGRGGGRSGAQR